MANSVVKSSVVQQMSKGQFEKLIQTIRSLAPDLQFEKGNSSKGSFANCIVRFAGQRDPDAVEEFISAVEDYKAVEKISDEDALKGISLLFARDASMWWTGVKRQARTWEDAIKLLREHFAPAKAPHEIYLEIFETKQGDSELIDTFICKKRALLAKLPEGLHNEETELNFIYGLLASKYRQQIPRHTVKTFRDLLEKARLLERH